MHDVCLIFVVVEVMNYVYLCIGQVDILGLRYCQRGNHDSRNHVLDLSYLLQDEENNTDSTMIQILLGCLLREHKRLQL